MAFVPENLGVSETGLPLLRELIHDRMGLAYENGRAELLSDRLAPLVVASVWLITSARPTTSPSAG